MGAAGSRDANSQEDAATLKSARISIKSKVATVGAEQDDGTGRHLEVHRQSDGELAYNVVETARETDANLSSSHDLAWISDPDARVKTASNALLKVQIRSHEVLHVHFVFQLSQKAVQEASKLSLACAPSMHELTRVLEERKRGSLQRHPAITILEELPDQSGHLSFGWTPDLSPDGSSGKLCMSLLSYQPRSDSFIALSTLSCWLEQAPSQSQQVAPTPHLVLDMANYLPTPYRVTPFGTPSLPASSSYLSPQPRYPLPHSRRSSANFLESTSMGKRRSYQSDVGSMRSASPGPSSDGMSSAQQYYSPQQQFLTLGAEDPNTTISRRPSPQRSATSPNLSSSPGNPAFISPMNARSASHPATYVAANSVQPGPVASASAVQDAIPLPGLNEFDEMPADDGPLFRAHLKEMEERASDLRRSLKGLLKSAEGVLSAMRMLDDAEYVFDRSLRDLASTNGNAIQPLNAGYYDMARKVQGFARKESMLRMEELVIDPLRRLISMLKITETKKKSFEYESKSFYDHVHKHLAVKNDSASTEGRQKASAADVKHKLRKDRFQVARLDYFNSLRDLALFKECSALVTLTHYAHAIHDINVAAGRDLDSSTLALDDLELRLDTLCADIEEKKMELELQRRNMEKTSASHRPEVIDAQQFFYKSRASLDSSMALNQYLSSPETQQMHLSPNGNRSAEALGMSTSPDVPPAHWLAPPSPGLSPNTSFHPDAAQLQLRKKEGFLWANSRPITHQGSLDNVRHWHKYWIVLAGGQLCEYADDRLELNTIPINLRFATVREAKMQDRRFTFEVITPSLRRIYQATSAEEAQTWLKAIANAIQSLLDGTSSVRHFVRPSSSQESHHHSDLGLGIFATPQRQTESGRERQAESSFLNSPNSGNSAADGVRAVFAKMNRPLQRRTSGKHSKRDSVSSIVSNIAAAANGRRRERDPSTSTPLTTLLEASQSVTSFFSGDSKQYNPIAHPKSASAQLDSAKPHSSSLAGPTDLSSSPRSAEELDHGIEAAVYSTFGPPKAIKQSRESKDQNARELQQLVRLPENRRCADCDEPDPRWASWNLGIFVCIRCSGLHRGLGSHISKVRSVDLDDWSDEQLACMKSTGNVAGRLTWEPPDLPAEMRSSENIAKLIKMKYADQRWRQQQTY